MTGVLTSIFFFFRAGSEAFFFFFRSVEWSLDCAGGVRHTLGMRIGAGSRHQGVRGIRGLGFLGVPSSYLGTQIMYPHSSSLLLG